ncbi:signal peptidase I [Kineococcus sp. NPDC059986]|uniref:signal peptidase I n=1 Tax=Kineococcus sp. NPDC059986 TaxID=3155538 RepID=UPI00344B2ED2
MQGASRSSPRARQRGHRHDRDGAVIDTSARAPRCDRKVGATRRGSCSPGDASTMINGMTDARSGDETTATLPSARSKQSPVGGFGAAVRETVLVLAVALVVSLVVKTFLAQAFFIPSESMEDTLLKGDRVIVSKLTPGPFDLHRGDVIVFSDPGHWLDPTVATRRGPVGTVVADALTFVGLLPEDSDEHLIKRVVGLPGDHVVCTEARSRVSVNGVAVDESAYLKPGVAPCGKVFDVIVPADRLWVMGDNRDHSGDSRYHPDAPYGGFVPVELVTGRAVAVVWPLGRGTWLGTPTDFDSVTGVSGVS